MTLTPHLGVGEKRGVGESTDDFRSWRGGGGFLTVYGPIDLRLKDLSLAIPSKMVLQSFARQLVWWLAQSFLVLSSSTYMCENRVSMTMQKYARIANLQPFSKDRRKKMIY